MHIAQVVHILLFNMERWNIELHSSTIKNCVNILLDFFLPSILSYFIKFYQINYL